MSRALLVSAYRLASLKGQQRIAACASVAAWLGSRHRWAQLVNAIVALTSA